MPPLLPLGLALLAATLLVGCQQDDAGSSPRPTADSGDRSTDASVRLSPVFNGVSFDSPVDIDALPGRPGHYFVTERPGRVVQVDTSGQVATVVDLTDRVASRGTEMGLLSLVFDVNFEATGKVFIYYSGLEERRATSRLSSLVFREGLLDAGSEEILIEETHGSPFHWGGGMEFGGDGLLYLGIGDGGYALLDDRHSAQDLTNIRGSVLRLDVSASGYAIPADNPFAGNQEGYRQEIWAYGFRNPWRLSVDEETGEIWVADVGAKRSEEVNAAIEAGGNYGWDVREGFECVDGDSCTSEGLIDPLATYSHDEGCAVIGGSVYRGRLLPDLVGRYVFADYCSGSIWTVSKDDPHITPLLATDEQIQSLGADEDGEILVLTREGTIFRLEPAH